MTDKLLVRIPESDRATFVSVRPLAWCGFAGSFIIALASLVSGWVNLDSVLMRMLPIAWLRTLPAASIVGPFVTTVGIFVLAYAWLRLGKFSAGTRALSLPSLARIIGLWSIPLILALPTFSRDVYAYIGQGRLVLAGVDPYEDGISTLNNWFRLGADTLWAESPTPYGQVFLWIEAAVVWGSGLMAGNPIGIEVSIILFKVLAIVSFMALLKILVLLARHLNLSPSRVTWLVGANPVVLINILVAVHNDGLMLVFVLLGLGCAYKKRLILATLMVVLAISVKPIAMLALPFIGIIVAGPGAAFGKRVRAWLLSGTVSLALLALMGWVSGFWFGWVKGMGTPYSVTGIGFLIPMYLLLTALSRELFNSDIIPTVVRTVITLSVCATLVIMILRTRYRDVLRVLTLCFALIVVTSAAMQSWYWVWATVFFALLKDIRVRCVHLFYTLTLIMLGLLLASGWPTLSGDTTFFANIASGVLALSALFYLTLINKHTRIMFVGVWLPIRRLLERRSRPWEESNPRPRD